MVRSSGRLATLHCGAQASVKLREAGAELPSGLPAHVAPRQEQHIRSGARTAPAPQDLARDPPDAAPGRGRPRRTPQGQDEPSPRA
jgi:hypothetical protein